MGANCRAGADPMRARNGDSIEILLVEDNPGDVALTRAALQDLKVANKLSVVGDGDSAMAFLHREGAHREAPRPDLVLLDLNLPGKDGREVLDEVKADPDLRRIPIVVLTTSSAEEDLLKAYDRYANCYITKPIDLQGLTKIVSSIEEFWFSIVRLPGT